MASGAIIGGYGDDGSASTFRFAPPFAISPLAMAPLSTFATSSIPQYHVRQENRPPLAHVRKGTHIKAGPARNAICHFATQSPLPPPLTSAATPVIPGADAAITVKTAPHETECFYEYVPGTYLFHSHNPPTVSTRTPTHSTLVRMPLQEG